MTMKLTGWEDLKKNLEELPNKVQRRVLKKSANAGARIVRDSARTKAPVHGPYPSSRTKLSVKQIERALKKLEASQDRTITVTTKKGKTYKTKARARQGIRSYQLRQSGRLKKGIDVGTPNTRFNWTSHRSTSTRTIYQNDVEIACVGFNKAAYYGAFLERGFKHRGGTHVPAHPMLRPALDENAQRVIDIMAGMLRQEIDRVRS
jgi:HK97 gp10 family phage protein